MVGIPRTERVKEYHFQIETTLSGEKIHIDSFVFARDYADADRLFYWKVLTEFMPKEYAEMISASSNDSCTVRYLPPEEDHFAHRGIRTFTALRKGETIRSVEKSRLRWKVENWHPGKTRFDAETNASIVIACTGIAFGVIFVLATLIRYWFFL